MFRLSWNPRNTIKLSSPFCCVQEVNKSLIIFVNDIHLSTPKTLSNYAILIANSAILDLLGAVACIITIPRLSSHRYINYSSVKTNHEFIFPSSHFWWPLWLCEWAVVLGVFQWGSHLFSSSSHSISGFLVYSLVLSHYLLCTSFAFRLFAVIRGRLSKTVPRKGQLHVFNDNVQNICASLVIVNAANLIVFFGIFSEFEHTHDSVSSLEEFTNETIGKVQQTKYHGFH